MSMVEAIARAKRLAKQRNAGASAPAAAPRVGAGIAAAAPGAQRFTQRDQYPVLNYQPSSCAQYRIAVPEADDQFLQNAASPYRMLRTRILQKCRTSNWTRLAITSPGPGEGKSVTTLNLALSLAKSGSHDVFLLDLDMRNPSVARYLGVAPETEISSYFQGDVEADKVFYTLGIDHLTLAGNVQSVANASELLAGSRLESLLAHIQAIAPNPLVLIDLPPVTSTDDALVVAPQVDALVLVVSEGRTRRDSLEAALTLLSEYTLAGVVMNRSVASLGTDYYGTR